MMSNKYIVKDREKETLKSVNTLSKKIPSQGRVFSIKELDEDFWLKILGFLFGHLREKIEAYFDIGLSSAINLSEYINYFKLFHQDLFSQVSPDFLLNHDLETIKKFSEGLELLTKTVRKSWTSQDPRRLAIALKEFSSLVFNLAPQHGGSCNSFADYPPRVWIDIFVNLFQVSDQKVLFDIFFNDSVQGIRLLLAVLSKKVLDKDIFYINPRLVVLGENVACIFLSEILVSLSRVAILQTFEGVRHFSFSTNPSGSDFENNLNNFSSPMISLGSRSLDLQKADDIPSMVPDVLDVRRDNEILIELWKKRTRGARKFH